MNIYYANIMLCAKRAFARTSVWRTLMDPRMRVIAREYYYLGWRMAVLSTYPSKKNAYFSYHGTDNCAAKSCLLIPQGRFGVEPVTGVSDGR